MTYREKLQREHPECVEDFYIGGCKNCPENYGYEEKEEKNENCLPEKDIEGRCRECWDREMEGGV